MYKLYEILIGEIQKVVDQEATADTPEKAHSVDVGRVGSVNVTAQSVEDALVKAKPFMKNGQYVYSANYLNDVHA